MNILEINNLKKLYGEKKILNNLSFSVKEGEILGFLGPNGAGKSTTINILSTVLKSDGGSVWYKGKPINENLKEYKRELGMVPQNLAIYEDLSTIDNIKFFAQFYKMSRNELEERCQEVLEMVGLLERKDDLAKTFSGGMKRRLNIACALTHHPKLLILDEPTVGVDPQSRNKIMEVIKLLQRQGTSVIYTTHYMEEVEAVCDRVAIIDEGTVLRCGALDELVSGKIETYFIAGENIENINFDFLRSIEGVTKIDMKGCLGITCVRDGDVFNNVLKRLLDNQVKIHSITREVKNLEKIFLKLTGKTLRD